MNPLRHTVGRAGRTVLSPRKVVVGATGEVNAAHGFDEVRPNLRELAERKRGPLAINRKRFLLPPLMPIALLDGVFILSWIKFTERRVGFLGGLGGLATAHKEPPLAGHLGGGFVDEPH